VDDYDPDFVYTDGTEPFTGRGTAKGVISDATVKLVAHMYNRRAARNGGVVDCMAVIKGGPRITGVASPREGGYLGPILRTRGSGRTPAASGSSRTTRSTARARWCCR
jgi:hypothetical protein